MIKDGEITRKTAIEVNVYIYTYTHTHMTRTAATNNFFLQKPVPYVIHPDKFKKKKENI